jgi:hypothetical protein
MNDFSMVNALLGAGGSIIVNKALARKIGLHEAIVYSELLSKEQYFRNKNQLDNEGYFYNVYGNMSEDTALSEKQIRAAVEKLTNIGLIKTKLSGIPPKKHYKIVKEIDRVATLLSEGQQLQQFGKKGRIDSAEMSDLIRQKGQTNNTNTIIIKNNPKNLYVEPDGFNGASSFFLSYYADYTGHQHPPVEESVWDDAIEYFNEIDYCYEDLIEEYFTEVEKSGATPRVNHLLAIKARFV